MFAQSRQNITVSLTDFTPKPCKGKCAANNEPGEPGLLWVTILHSNQAKREIKWNTRPRLIDQISAFNKSNAIWKTIYDTINISRQCLHVLQVAVILSRD